MHPPQQPPLQLDLTVPPDMEGGTYASFASIWRDPDGFILDFAVAIKPAEPGTDDNGAPVVMLTAKVVSRIRIPYGQAWEFMKGLTAQLGEYEMQNGISQPGDMPES